jgi:vitamin B12 transporter
VQSFTSDALGPSTNPNFPKIAIGNLSPLIGARPFRRPPNSGYFSMQYTRAKFSMAIKGAMASRSDDSTYLGGNDVNYGNSLLLPNHDLDFGYVKLDVGGTYALPHHLTLFTQLENLTNDQHIGPIGYPGLPLTVRAGLKLKLFGD